MKPINYTVGDATNPQIPGNKIIAHICNDIGAWGKGFVLAVSKLSPAPERAYRDWYKGREQNDFVLGAVQFVRLSPEISVANMIGQHGIRTIDGRVIGDDNGFEEETLGFGWSWDDLPDD